jgi:hypothetical protein
LYDIRRDPNYIRDSVGKQLKPSRFVGEHGAEGVYKVCKDHSLVSDGVEVATVGRRVQFMPLYLMVKKIMDICRESGAYTDERCSIHIHLLASYLTRGFSDNDRGREYIRQEITELERSLPEIVLANFHQLVRRYHCALIWMTTAGETKKHLTRWSKFRKPVLPYSALKKKMVDVVEEVGSASKSKRKYSMMNYQQIGFDEDGQVSRFHVEARYLDGCFSPSAVAAHACLLYGLLLKAVEISRHGVLRAGTKEYMLQQNEMLNHLCNGTESWDGPRHSDNSGLDPYIPILQAQSRDLVLLMKNTLTEETPADIILHKLSQRPLSIRRAEGETWEQIEADLAPTPAESSPVGAALVRLIDTVSVLECLTRIEWSSAAADQIAQETGAAASAEKTAEIAEEVRALTEQGEKKNRLFWSADLGGYLRS